MVKKIFMIAVTDKEISLNRKYTETIFDLLTVNSPFVEEYVIEPHYKQSVHDLHQSLHKALNGDRYEGYIVLLDSLTEPIYNPNVMFELGAIFYSEKPYVVISSHPKESVPFDINIINIIDIPHVIVNYVEDCHKNSKEINAYQHFYLENRSAETSIVIKFLTLVHHQYKTCLRNIDKTITGKIELKNVLDEVKGIKKLLSNTAEYIDGEKAAFRNLGEAVRHAKISLRTTRFANESIVKDDSIEEKKKFMESLYDASKDPNLNDKFYRIICNNHPAKWQDIYNILFFGGNGAKVFVRKHDFSIHFELVIIDDKIAFIHFYQANSRKEEGQSVKEVERLKSTLKIQGSSICQKLSDIFDRLHHRDFSKGDPSRTLLGIPVQDGDLDEKCKNYGSFVVNETIPTHSLYGSNANDKRKEYIIQMFKDAFLTWHINEFHDKTIMASGISLLEGNDNFIEKMKNIKLDEREYAEAKQLYADNQKKQ
ncbi:hypothetical protein [Parablautia muri]|uniref:Uncharacterized protein n=1 Tax=Parablautia muri TaxID=2320879 RepID=A0A9X5BCN0_9FIRM|nr:hypothetical protein [Parablautia muri]NBJ91380.1 hypothetical protein [Parablautia muri]